MNRLLTILICIVMLAGCGVTENQKMNKTDVKMELVSAESLATESLKLPFLGKVSADDIDKILYFDDSQPTDSPTDTYYAFEEVDKIFKMFEGIALTGEINELSTAAPGDYCGYKIYLKDDTVYTVWRSGKVLSCGGKTYEYTGDFYRQLHIGEVAIYASGDNSYPPDGKIKLKIKAFDEENTLIEDDPILNQLIGTKWTIVKPAQPHNGARIPVSDFPQYIDFKNDYPQAFAGDFCINYHVFLPDGKEKDITAQFTVFNNKT